MQPRHDALWQGGPEVRPLGGGVSGISTLGLPGTFKHQRRRPYLLPEEDNVCPVGGLYPTRRRWQDAAGSRKSQVSTPSCHLSLLTRRPIFHIHNIVPIQLPHGFFDSPSVLPYNKPLWGHRKNPSIFCGDKSVQRSDKLYLQMLNYHNNQTNIQTYKIGFLWCHIYIRYYFSPDKEGTVASLWVANFQRNNI